MARLPPRFERAARGLLVYLWSLPTVLWLADLMDWRYDGDLAWLLAAIWISPAYFIGDFTGLALTAMVIPYLLILSFLTLLFLLRNRVHPTIPVPRA